MNHSTSIAKNKNSPYRVSVEQLLTFLFLAACVIGSALSFSKLYLFHVVLISIFFFTLLGQIKLRKSSFYFTRYLFLFFIFIILSTLWAPNKINALYYIFYVTCGLSITFFIINYSKDLRSLDFVFKVLSIFYILNFSIGLIETTGLFRFPSPYSIELPGSTKPSGFDSNVNNFGFVFMSIFPFLYFYPKKWVRFISLLVIAWFTIKLQSKGFFLSVILFFIVSVLVEINRKSTWYWITIITFSLMLPAILYILSNPDISFQGRIFTTFSQIDRGIDLMVAGDVGDGDSTSVRALMYWYGIKELISTNGLGLGLAGISSELAVVTDLWAEADKDIVSFHNFFLEILVDLGVIPYLIIMYSYIRLIAKCLNFSKKLYSHTNARLGYYCKASAISLIIILPASIAPSTIIYVFTFWIVIGFSISATKIACTERI